MPGYVYRGTDFTEPRTRKGVLAEHMFNPALCGTNAGFHQHHRHAQTKCGPCKQAHRDYDAAYRAKVKAKKEALSRCGTANGYKRHQKLGETACKPCRAGMAEYSRNYRLRILSGEVILKKPFTPDRCGTYAGFRLHTKHKIPPCDPCRKAHQEYQRAYRAKRKAEMTANSIA
jgi:hypothetical protein